MLTFSEEAIVDNCKRILQFYHEDRVPEIIDYSPKGLLMLYGRILDYNGAPRSGLSLLYLNGNDYKEMEYFVMPRCEDFMKSEKSFRFTYLGYNWAVINK